MDELQYSPVYDEKTMQNLDQQFSRIKGECYVDHAGATLYSDNQIKKSLNGLLSSVFTNPHSSSIYGNITEEAIDNIRYNILDHFHTTQDEYSIIFTSGATASLKIVAETFDFNNNENRFKCQTGNFVYLQDNHTSVLGMRDVVAQRGAEVVCIDHNQAFNIFQNFSSRNNCNRNEKTNSLFTYPAQCNFSGLKYPLSWIEKIKNGCLNTHLNKKTNWFTLIDAASFAATNDLDLSIFKPDFVCISFYKLFGYPTGVGALLVKNDCIDLLKKVYYGGGTVKVVLSSKMHHVKKEALSDRFEDGTISFLAILSLQHGFQILSEISMNMISKHVFSLAKHLHHSMLKLHHQNGNPLVKLYSDTDYEDERIQGGIVSFNILRANGEYVGYMEVLNMASLYKIHLRTGCFCNPGACQRHLNLSDEEILQNYNSGYTCGGTTDIVDGKPTGAIRISFGYMSTINDVETVLKMLKNCFVTGKEILKNPSWWPDFQYKIFLKYEFQAKQLSVNHLCNGFRNESAQIPEKEINLQNEKNVILQEKYLTKNNNKQNNKIKLSKIFIYPIKSCGRFEVDRSWKLTSKGLQYDREWMIVSSSGVCLTQKQETKLCLLMPVIDFRSNRLKLNYPGMPSINIPLEIFKEKIVDGKICRGKICGHKVEGIDCGLEVSEWLSLALGRPNLKLVRQYEINESKQSLKPELSFASQSQYLLINEASISWLANKISDDSECNKNTILHRFRGNFLIEGCSPFEETQWKSVQIGDCIFEVEGVCTRCQMVCIDQTTGKKTVEPLRTLAEEFHGKLKFGIYLVKKFHHNNAIKLEDEVIYD